MLEAIAAAPPQFRDAVIAVDLLGLSYAEAARQLGAPEDTIASRLNRGRAHVARRLTRHGHRHVTSRPPARRAAGAADAHQDSREGIAEAMAPAATPVR